MYRKIFALLFLSLCPKLIFSAVSAPVHLQGDEMEIRQKGAITVFKGSVKLTYAESVFNADEMIDYNKQNRVEASGNIYSEIKNKERQELLKIYAQKAWVDKNRGEGEMIDKVVVIYSTSPVNVPVQLNAKTVKFWLQPADQKKLYASGEVEFTQGEYRAYSEQAWFYEKERKMVLTGNRPRIVEKDDKNSSSEYSAEQITIFLDEKKIVLEKDVKVEFYPPEK
ncbi:MAG: LptA/OstA family protein [Elusimicrobiota bacterium]